MLTIGRGGNGANATKKLRKKTFTGPQSCGDYPKETFRPENEPFLGFPRLAAFPFPLGTIFRFPFFCCFALAGPEALGFPEVLMISSRLMVTIFVESSFGAEEAAAERCCFLTLWRLLPSETAEMEEVSEALRFRPRVISSSAASCCSVLRSTGNVVKHLNN